MRCFWHKTLLPLLLLLGLLAPAPALAQQIATLGEKSIGTACNNGANAVNFDTLAQCSATSGNGIFQKAPLFVGRVTSPPYATTACDAAKAGILQYTASNSFQVCNGTNWTTLSAGSSCPAFTSGSQIFTSSGTFTPPGGITNSCPLTIRVVMIGGGGAGVAGGYSTQGFAGGGSGLILAAQLSLTSTASISITVGAGGIATASQGSTGAMGGTTYFRGLSVHGGQGGYGVGTSLAASFGGGYGSGGGGGQAWNGGAAGAGGAIGYSGGLGWNNTESVSGAGGLALVPSSVLSGNTVMGITFNTATFSSSGGAAGYSGVGGFGGSGYGAGGGGSNGTIYAAAGGGGGGGLIINGASISAGNGTVGSTAGSGAAGVVYVEW